MIDHPKESGHWYRRNGTPVYTIIGKNGKERPATLRDARKEDPHLVPGVTTIIGCAAKRGLEVWKIRQAVLSSLTLPKVIGETEDEYFSRIISDSKEEAAKAAERGKLIHAYIQTGFEGDESRLSDEGRLYYWAAKEEIENTVGVCKWKCEIPFANKKFGGKIDLVSGKKWLLDIKTKDTPLEGLKLWDEHYMQLAAYMYGYGHTGEAGIVFVSTKEVKAKLIIAEPEKLKRGLEMFWALMHFWYAKTSLGK